VSVTSDEEYTSVTIEEEAGYDRHQPDTDCLMIGTKDGSLKQWDLTDPQGWAT